jgi:Na+-driven multidrug efflux pump
VSNEIGAGNVERAKNAVSVTMKLSVFLAVSFVLLLAFGHNLWASLFSRSSRIISEFAAITPLMMISIVLDSAQGVLSGVSRGCGWQHMGAMTNLVAFYLVGMPLAILFSFRLKFYTKVALLRRIIFLKKMDKVPASATAHSQNNETKIRFFFKKIDKIPAFSTAHIAKTT